GREAGGEDGGELRLEVVRLVDDQESAPPQPLGVPVTERGEVGGVGAEDRPLDGRRPGARVRALAERAARPAAGAARGRYARRGGVVARVVVAPLHDLELGAERARVRSLKHLLLRARDLRNQPVWTLPKGTLDPGESSADAALREVREETGYRCEVVRELDAVTYWFQRDGRRIKKTVRWFLMRPLEKVGDHDQ